MTKIVDIKRYLNTGEFDAQRAATFDLSRAKGSSLKASFVPQKDIVYDDKERTVEFSFASGDAIEHWFGYAVLDLSKDAADLSRVEAGVCPFLVNHDRDDQIGVVVNCEADGNVLRGSVKFSDSDRGEEMFRDVKNGIRNGTSIGFMVQDLILTEQKDGEIPIYTITKWTMLENSLASVPADIAVGACRKLETPSLEVPAAGNSNTGERQMPNEETVGTTPATPTAGSPAVERSAEVIAAERTSAIIDFATCFGEKAVARAQEMLVASENVTLEDVRVAIRAMQPPTVKVPVEDPAAVALRMGGIAPGENVQLATSVYRGGALKSFKGEKHIERAYRAGMFLLATLSRNQKALEFCQANGLIRAHSGELNSTGGFLVPDEFDSTLIDLRIQYGAFRRNANVVPMASDTLIRPRRTGGLTAYFTGGGDAATESTKAWDSVTLVAKKLSVLTKYEMELSDDAAINIADDLASEIAYAFAQKEDNCGFNGDGTSTYGGIVGVCAKLLGLSATRANIAGLQVASGNAWSEIVIGDIQGVVGKLPQFARLSGNVKFYCSHEFYATVLMRLAQAVGGVTATEIQNGFGPSFFGVPVEFVEVMPHVEANDAVCLLYGNLSQAAMLGDRRGTTIAMTDSDSTDFAKAIKAIRGDTRFDINVHDVGNQSGTATLRTPGPIVGLLTAAS